VDSGAAFIECDASLTRDEQFVCRHATCDLAFTTDVLARHPELAAKCSSPFEAGNGTHPSTAECCTYDFTLLELSTLCALMESETNPHAAHAADFVSGPPGFRSGYIASATCHRLVSLEEYLAYAASQGVSVIPELKDTALPQYVAFLHESGRDIYWLADEFASQIYRAGFSAPRESHEWGAEAEAGRLGVMQTFDARIALHWKRSAEWGAMPVEWMWAEAHDWLDRPAAQCPSAAGCGTLEWIDEVADAGVEILSPHMGWLLGVDGHRLVPSAAAERLMERLKEVRARKPHAAFPAIGSWSLARSGCTSLNPQHSPDRQPAAEGPCGGYWTKTGSAAFQSLDILFALDVLLNQIEIVALFSDFPAVVSAFVNCAM
jgi:glycerophosphoryl diester phosphodiesterase